MKYPPQLEYSPGVEECNLATVARVNKPNTKSEMSSTLSARNALRRLEEAGVMGDKKTEAWKRVKAEQTSS